MISKQTLVLLVSSASLALAAETIIFQDDFDKLNFTTWEHELTMGGGGNWEFEWYVNNRSNSYVRNSTLFIKPTLTEDAIGDVTLRSGTVDIWGASPADQCTGNAFYGCMRSAPASGNYINPIRSARLRSTKSFAFKYGRFEVRAKLPQGDWLWPAIWLLPKYNEYGNWPASGEIDVMESRGNGPSYPAGGNNKFASTLHWGTNWDQNQFQRTHAEFDNTKSLGEDFHVYGLYWDSTGIYTYLDNDSNRVLKVNFTEQGFFQRGQFPPSFDNPWVGEDNAAPFNREFYIILNLAVGGTNSYFPDGVGGKPWNNQDPHAPNAFYNAKGQWYPTWKGEDAALQIDWIKVTKLDGQQVHNEQF